MVSVSVIVPIYNVEEQIEQCARTLFEQTLNSLEYIFVDDATPDNSVEILKRVIDDYPQRKDSIRILHHEINKGLPAARQTGLKEAVGEYIINCDSDDWVDKDMYRQLYLFAKENDLDMAFCDYYNIADNGEVSARSCASSSSPDLIEDAFMRHLPFSIWTKLIKRNIAMDNRVEEAVGSCGEDLSTTLQVALLCSSIGHIDIPLYYYRRRKTSITSQNDFASIIRKQKEFENNFEQVARAISNANKVHQYDSCIEHYSLHVKNGLLPALASGYPTKFWRDSCKSLNKKVIFSSLFTRKEKLLFILTYIGLYPMVKQLINKRKLRAIF